MPLRMAVRTWNFSKVTMAKEPALAIISLATMSESTWYSNFIAVFDSEILKAFFVADTKDWMSSISAVETSAKEEIPSFSSLNSDAK